tara:strand:- start:6819 stop:7361 length:543 start_codon:yes stop_codon:yes gene_type:complete
MKTETERYARQCDVTGEGMNEGYCIQDGLMYIKHEKDLLKHLREVEKEGNPEYDTLVAEGRLTDEFLLDEYYDEEYYLWTEWYEDIEYAGNMEIIESNKLIAEFMGIVFPKLGNVIVKEDELQYHTSWHWLMPVVKKCRVDSRCEHDEDIFWDAIHWALEECSIENTYKAVVEFINQYKK